MSTVTKRWSEEAIRHIIYNLDKKTGLKGADLPIDFKASGYYLGYYRYATPKSFSFNRKFFDDPNTKEAAVVDVIRHEYAHYYTDVVGLEIYIGHSARETSHGADWKWACKMVGANPIRCYESDAFQNSNWDFYDALAAYDAEDVHEFDILAYTKKWNTVPMNPEKDREVEEWLKENKPQVYCEVGDEIVLPAKGFGTVQEVIPFAYRTSGKGYLQKIDVEFEDKTHSILITGQFCKVVDGVVIA